jgi:uncharacterized membrane protein
MNRTRSWISALFSLILVLYPVCIFFSLVIFKVRVRYISVFIILFAAAYLLFGLQTSKNDSGRHKWTIFMCPALLLALAVVCFTLDTSLALKLYPFLSDFVYLAAFGSSLIAPPPIVYHYVVTLDKNADDRLPVEILSWYCRVMTLVWCVFFALDAVAAYITVRMGSDIIWGIYNGGVSYACMGLILLVQVIIYKNLCDGIVKNG